MRFTYYEQDRLARRVLERFDFEDTPEYGRMPSSVVTREGELIVDERALTISVCKASFFHFVKEFWSVIIAEPPVWNWHIEYLCNRMQELAEDVFAGRQRKHDLLVNIPPGTTKSTIISIMFTAWVWTRMPSAQIIGASHTEELAGDLSFKARDIVMSDKYKDFFPEAKLRSDRNTKTLYQTTAGGWRYAVGSCGSVIGKHAHFIIIDDPIDPESANSSMEVTTTNRWIKETLNSRKLNKAVTLTVLVMQRLHEDDPANMFLEKNRKFLKKNPGQEGRVPVAHICLPAEITEDVFPAELRKNYIKGLLDPIRLGKRYLEEFETNGEFYYGSQFLQRPMGKTGNMFKVDRIKTGVPPNIFLSVVRYWDKAGTKGGGDFTVGTKIGKDLQGRFWVLDVKRFQEDSFERERIIEQTAESDGKQVKIVVEQEPGSGGKDSAMNTVRRLAGYSVHIDKVSQSTGSKEQRADSFSVQMNAGNVYVVEGVDWFTGWKDEHKFFPYSKYKDQVDSAAGAFNHSHKKKRKAGAMGVNRDFNNMGVNLEGKDLSKVKGLVRVAKPGDEIRIHTRQI